MKKRSLFLMAITISTFALADTPASIKLNVGANLNHIKIEASGYRNLVQNSGTAKQLSLTDLARKDRCFYEMLFSIENIAELVRTDKDLNALTKIYGPVQVNYSYLQTLLEKKETEIETSFSDEPEMRIWLRFTDVEPLTAPQAASSVISEKTSLQGGIPRSIQRCISSLGKPVSCADKAASKFINAIQTDDLEKCKKSALPLFKQAVARALADKNDPNSNLNKNHAKQVAEKARNTAVAKLPAEPARTETAIDISARVEQALKTIRQNTTQ